MKSLWDQQEAQQYENDPLAMRVYTSRLLGRDPSLVMHGGGNTSLKMKVTNLFGEEEDILYVKGSGWDLATIEAPGFAPVRLSVLEKMATLEALTDSRMVSVQRSAMIDPNAPNPSVEAILHAILPFTYVDHTHADAVVAISNTPDGEARIHELYGEKVLIIPYVMPGFILSKEIYNRLQEVDITQYEGMILLNHGVFSFANDARTSYERMIELVDMAEQYLQREDALQIVESEGEEDLTRLAQLRKAVSELRGGAVVARLNNSSKARGFSSLPEISDIALRGTLTPDHVIRTKPKPLMLGFGAEEELQGLLKNYVDGYQAYFERNTDGSLTCLEPSPRWAVWKGHGTVSFGRSEKEAMIIHDINEHTMEAIQWAEHLGRWETISEKDLFDMEYWELEQAKLKKKGKGSPLQGKIVLVTGAASGIGRACVEVFAAQGAVVAALDISPCVCKQERPGVLGLHCDVTDADALKKAVEQTVRHFGGLDIVVSNAGNFPPSRSLENMESDIWEKSMRLNLFSHQYLLSACIPYLKEGVEPAVIVVASKNVPAPGPGASAYSVAKAGLTQLSRVAALELARYQIRVNTLHPNAVFDTGIWTDDVLQARAAHYGISVQEYKTNNLLKVEIQSKDVAELAALLASPAFAKTTGAQIPIDGGNERVI